MARLIDDDDDDTFTDEEEDLVPMAPRDEEEEDTAMPDLNATTLDDGVVRMPYKGRLIVLDFTSGTASPGEGEAGIIEVYSGDTMTDPLDAYDVNCEITAKVFPYPYYDATCVTLTGDALALAFRWCDENEGKYVVASA